MYTAPGVSNTEKYCCYLFVESHSFVKMVSKSDSY